MAFWDKKITDPKKQLKKITKYYRQVMGLSKEDAEKKAKEWMDTVGKGPHPGL